MTRSSTLPVVLDRDRRRPAGRPARRPASATGSSPGPSPVGRRLPSTRALAADLGVSRRGHRAGLRPAAPPRAGWRAAAAPGRSSPPEPAPAPRRTDRRAPRARGSRLVRLDTGTPWIDPRHRAALATGLARRLGGPCLRGGTTTRAGCPSCASELADHLAPHPRPDLRPRRDPGHHRHHRRPDASCSPPSRRAPVAHEDPGYRAAAEAIRAPWPRACATSRPREPVTDLAGVRRPRTSRPPTSTRSAR